VINYILKSISDSEQAINKQSSKQANNQSPIKMSNHNLSFFEKMLENMGGIQDADGVEYRKKGERNGASVARQLYRVIPKKDLADRILMGILKRYEEELLYNMSAWKYAHNINGEELGLELQGFGTGVTFIGHLMCIMQGKYSAEKAESVALENKWVVELDAKELREKDGERGYEHLIDTRGCEHLIDTSIKIAQSGHVARGVPVFRILNISAKMLQPKSRELFVRMLVETDTLLSELARKVERLMRGDCHVVGFFQKYETVNIMDPRQSVGDYDLGKGETIYVLFGTE